MKKIIILLFILIIYTLSSAQTFTILYTNNLDGVIKSCGCPGNEFGGIAYLASYINQYREQNPNIILLDNGDFLPMKNLPPKAQYTISLLKAINYDAINIGDQEFWFGLNYLKDRLKHDPIPILSASIWKKNERVFPPYLVKEFDWGSVGIIGFIPEEIFNLIEENKKRGCKADNQEFDKIFTTLKAKVDLIILLAHAPIKICKQIAAQFQGIDIIIAAHDQKRITEPIKINETLVVEAGKYGEYLGVLEINMVDNKIQDAIDLSIPIYPLKKLEPPIIDTLVIAHDQSNQKYLSEIKKKSQTNKTTLNNNSLCIKCHFNQGKQYEMTPHSTAFETLVSFDETKDPDCLQCHTTAFAEPGGYTSLTNTADLRNVSCISCHKNLAQKDLEIHKKEAQNPTTTTLITEATCLKCHNKQWSPNFDFTLYRKFVTHDLKIHKVKEGESLSAIAKKYYYKFELWTKIADANKYEIQNPDIIFPDQEFIIPKISPKERKTTNINKEN